MVVSHQTSMRKYSASIDDVRAAAKRIKGIGHRTPVLTNKTLDRLSGRKLFFKCENFQKIGAFKFRGGWNAISSLNEEEAKKELRDDLYDPLIIDVAKNYLMSCEKDAGSPSSSPFSPMGAPYWGACWGAAFWSERMGISPPPLERVENWFSP